MPYVFRRVDRATLQSSPPPNVRSLRIDKSRVTDSMVLFVLFLAFLASFTACSNAFTCNNGKLIPCNDICDGVADCGISSRNRFYESDEDEDNCSTFGDFADDGRKCTYSDAFHCTDSLCICPEGRCDGNKDCRNGKDEENCGFDIYTKLYLNTGKNRAIQWMRSQLNTERSWNEHIHRGIVALFLSGGANFSASNKDNEVMAKQLELQVATYLLRRGHGEVSSIDLAAYINALLVICHDPRNFFGYNLISYLKEDLDANSSFVPPYLYLTLCNANESISEDAIVRLLNILNHDSQTHGFVVDIQALAMMTLSCIISNGNKSEYIVGNVTEALYNLKKLQMEDGSFGNIYTTALMLQTLIANNQGIADDWKIKSAVTYLSSAQKDDGSFGNFLTTYLILPLLNAKSLLDVGKINCSFKRQSDVNTTMDMKKEPEKKIIVKYSLFIGDEKDHWYSLTFRTPENITVLDLMTLAVDLNRKYEFKIHEVRNKKYVYEISNIPNDPEHSKFWFIYQRVGNDTVPILEQSPDNISVKDNDDIIMWYKTLDSL